MTIALKNPLAFDVDRNPIPMPRHAVAWRVRFVRNGMLSTKRGGPAETVTGRDGSPLYLEITATRADLAEEVSVGGLYRLDAVDASLSVIANVSPAYVEVPIHAELGVVAALCVGALHVWGSPALLPRSQERTTEQR